MFTALRSTGTVFGFPAQPLEQWAAQYHPFPMPCCQPALQIVACCGRSRKCRLVCSAYLAFLNDWAVALEKEGLELQCKFATAVMSHSLPFAAFQRCRLRVLSAHRTLTMLMLFRPQTTSAAATTRSRLTSWG